MDVAFHFHATDSASFPTKGHAERRLLGLLRLSADFSRGPVDVYGGVFRNWMLQRHLPQDWNEQNRRAKIQQTELLFRKRWQQESVNGWYWLGDHALGETSPATDFMVVRNLSPQIAELICHGMKKRAYLQCAFEVSRRSDIQSAIYYELAEQWYSFSSNRSAAYFLPYGADDDPVAAWRLRRLGFTEIERFDEMPSMEDTFFLVLRLLDEEANPNG